VTVIEGRTLEETAEILVAAGFGNERRLLSLLRSPELIADLDPEAQDLEGYLFPETYSFARGAGERQVVETMVRTQAERMLRDMDVVSREEFEAVKEMAAKAREENERLAARLAELEAKGAPRGR